MCKLVQIAPAALLCALAGPFVSRAPAQQAEQGEWETEMTNWGVVARHAVLLKNGKVLYFGRVDASPNARVFDPTDQTFTDVELPSKLYCSAHSQLADGRVVFVGGNPQGVNNETWIFDPDKIDPPNDPWSRADDMVYNGEDAPRWYATCTTLGDGKVLVTAGRRNPNDPTDPALIPVVFDAAAAPGQQYTWLDESASLDLVYFPFTFQISSGKVFLAGGVEMGSRPKMSRNLNIALSTWTDVATYAQHGVSAVMYRPDRVMKGGGYAPNMFTIDVSAFAPAWVQVDTMDYTRFRFYLIAMPDGRVLAVGGEDEAPQDPSAILVPQWYDPDQANPVWESLAQMSSARMLHSTALLLPDARVVIAGGELDGGQETAQIFKPPYLFDINDQEIQPGVRPVIAQPAPDEMYYAGSIVITTQQAADITDVNLVGLGAPTHGFDQNQRFVPLEFTTGLDTLTIAAPAHGYLAPPGYYMLFILKDGDRAGIKYPSLAELIKLGPAP